MWFCKIFQVFFCLIKLFIKYGFCLLIHTASSLEVETPDEYFSLPSTKAARLNTLLQNSVLTANQNPEAIAAALDINEYDPLLLSVLAIVNSELPKHRIKRKTFQLPPSKEAKACKKPISITFRQSQTNNPYTFIIFPAPYTILREGSFINQLSDILDKNFNFPNIIVFNGYLSSAFLKNSCQSIPWDFISLATDLHLRLKKYLNENNLSPEHTGIIGASGGGSLVLALLAQASNIFGLGGMSLSPFLHARAILYNLDLRHSQSIINPTWGLSTGDLKNLWYFLNIFTLPKQEQVMYLYNKNPREFKQRVFNEFTVSYLRDTLKGLRYHPSDINGEMNYYDVFINTDFLQDNDINESIKTTTMTGISNNIDDFSSVNQNFSSTQQVPNHSSINAAFDQAISLQNVLPLIDKPLFIYSAQDDPIIFPPDESNPLFRSSLEILETAKNNSHIMVFNPPYGSHVGILLDPIFEELITTFFKP